MTNYIYLTVLLFLTLNCTDLFSTREDKVEKPTGTGVGTFEEATSPENVLINYRRALENMNTDYYLDTFSNPDEFPSRPYYFYGDANFNAQLPDPPWDYREEKIFATNLLADNTIFSITFNYVDSLPDIRYLSTGNDSLEIAETEFFNYEIIIKNKDSAKEKVYQGQSSVKFFRSAVGSELWYVTDWLDKAIDTVATLSILKLERYQGQ